MIEDLGTKIKQTGNAGNNIFDMFKKKTVVKRCIALISLCNINGWAYSQLTPSSVGRDTKL